MTEGGERTAGPYRLVRRLGSGGFGEVFLGESPQGGRAAVKLLHPGLADQPELRSKFTAEVEQARKVSAFCTADILDADPQAAQPWIATEYIDGPTLESSVEHDGPRHGADLHRLAVSIATALTAIHAAGVVHRDLKPANILLADDGPRVIDFGIARAVEGTSTTASGAVGTIGYMAPEQVEGARVIPAVDIFAWGAVLVYAATGHEPFEASTQTARMKRILLDDPDTGDLADPLLSIVRTCLAKPPGERPAAGDLFNRLVTIPGDAGVAGTAPSATEPTVAPDGTLRYAEEEPYTLAPDGTLLYTEREPHASVRDAPPVSPGGVSHGTRYDAPPRYPEREREDGPRHPEQGRGDDVEGVRFRPPSDPNAVPPFRFAGGLYTDPRDLAAAMQGDWDAAVEVFSDPERRSGLASWVITDVGDTTVDRSVLRHAPDGADLALASFVAQLRPDLPPVFRDRDASLAAVRRLFAATNGSAHPQELRQWARIAVLEVLALHSGSQSGEYGKLAPAFRSAEKAGLTFLRELRARIAGMRSAREQIDPVVLLRYLLHPDQVDRDGDAAGTEDAPWRAILWQRVLSARGPERAGHAAAIHAVGTTVRDLAGQESSWRASLDATRAELDSADRNRKLTRGLFWGSIGGLALGLLWTLAACTAGTPFQATGVAGFLLMLSSVVGFALANHWRGPSIARLHQLHQHYARLLPVVQAMDRDLTEARQLCGNGD